MLRHVTWQKNLTELSRVSKSANPRIVRGLETSIDGFWGNALSGHLPDPKTWGLWHALRENPLGEWIQEKSWLFTHSGNFATHYNPGTAMYTWTELNGLKFNVWRYVVHKKTLVHGSGFILCILVVRIPLAIYIHLAKAIKSLMTLAYSFGMESFFLKVCLEPARFQIPKEEDAVKL